MRFLILQASVLVTASTLGKETPLLRHFLLKNANRFTKTGSGQT
jgi:hypothetical protein